MNADFGRALGRYAIFDEIAAGGMATVHLGRLMGPVGFSRTVAIKRLHPHFAHDEEFVAMFLDEARLAARIQHPNVVATLDVVQTDRELFLVMEYIRGESLSWLRREVAKTGGRIPIEIAASVMAGALYGLHAAHEATSEQGVPLSIVHRDVSPQNIMIGNDGIPRVIDFGVAKATSRLSSTQGGAVKGKLAYMAPEQLRGAADRRSDVYAAGVVLWELLTGERLFEGENDGQMIVQVTQGCDRPPSSVVPDVPRSLDQVVMWALTVDPARRCPTARDFAIALEGAMRPATPRELAEWLQSVAGSRLAQRVRRVAEIESLSSGVTVGPDPGFPGERHSFAGSSAAASSFGGSSQLSTQLPFTPGSAPGSAPGGAPPPPFSQTPSKGTQLNASRSSDGAEHRGRRMLVGMLSASIALVVAGGVALLMLGPSGAPARTDAAALTDASASTRPPAHPAVAAVVADAGGPSPTASVTASAPAPQPGVPSQQPPGAVRAPPAARPTAKPPPAAKDCDPPYTIDSAGVKRYKPACL